MDTVGLSVQHHTSLFFSPMKLGAVWYTYHPITQKVEAGRAKRGKSGVHR